MTELEISLANKLMELEGIVPEFDKLTEYGKAKWKARVDEVLEIVSPKA